MVFKLHWKIPHTLYFMHNISSWRQTDWSLNQVMGWLECFPIICCLCFPWLLFHKLVQPDDIHTATSICAPAWRCEHFSAGRGGHLFPLLWTVSCSHSVWLWLVLHLFPHEWEDDVSPRRWLSLLFQGVQVMWPACGDDNEIICTGGAFQAAHMAHSWSVWSLQLRLWPHLCPIGSASSPV